MKANEYQCSSCKGIFESGWSEEEAIAEKDANFDNIKIEDCEIVCDDCYNKIMNQIPMQFKQN